MKTLVVVELAGVSKEVKGLELCKPTYLKTKTKLEFEFTEKSFEELDILGSVDADVSLLGLSAAPASVTFTTEGAKALGRFINRGEQAMERVGVTVIPLAWDATAGVVIVQPGSVPLAGNDMGALVETMSRLIIRSMGAATGTQHPLTLFDLQQATGIFHAAKQGDENANTIMGWMKGREIIVLEEIKAAAKAEREADKTAKAKAAAAEDRKKPIKGRTAPKPAAKAKEGTEKNAGKASRVASKVKVKSKTANLGNLTPEPEEQES